MEETALISVIVPVYKVEAYLDRCVQSIVDQTYRNLEIILVDDGSPDNCGAMCDAWAEKDTRIKVIHKENGGVSSARNVGIEAANGKYVCFVDSDDWVDLRYIEILHRVADEYDADVTVCKTICFSNTDSEPSAYLEVPAVRLGDNKGVMESLVYGGGYRGAPWDKMYRKDMVCGVKFPEGYRHEDEFFAHRVALRVKRVAYVDAPLYVYCQIDGSFMHEFTIGRLDILAAFWERMGILAQEYPELYPIWKVKFCNTCVNIYAEMLKAKPGDFAIYDQRIRAYRKRVRITAAEFWKLPLARKAYVLGGRVPYLFCAVLNFMREKRNSGLMKSSELNESDCIGV